MSKSTIIVIAILSFWAMAGSAAFPVWAEDPPPTPKPEAEEEDPRVVSLRQADQRLRRFDTKEAREALKPLAERSDKDLEVALAFGRLLEQEKKYNDALKTLDAAVKLAPNDPSPQLVRGDVLLRANRTQDANRAFTRARDLAREVLKTDEKDADAHYALGLAQLRLRQFDAAQKALLEARKLRPDDAMTEYQLGVLRAFQNRAADSVTHLTKALELSPDMAYAYFYRGMSHDRTGRKDLLVADMERFLRLAPDAPEAERARAIVRAAGR